jgi:hypothetical protein
MLLWTFIAANKDELMWMITVGADKTINTNDEYFPFYVGANIPELCNISLMINDIDTIFHCGEEHTVNPNNRYKGLNLGRPQQLQIRCYSSVNFQSGPSNFLMQLFWRTCLISVFKKAFNFHLPRLWKHERKTNHFVDSYFKYTLHSGPSKTNKATKIHMVFYSFILLVQYRPPFIMDGSFISARVPYLRAPSVMLSPSPSSTSFQLNVQLFSG